MFTNVSKIAYNTNFAMKVYIKIQSGPYSSCPVTLVKVGPTQALLSNRNGNMAKHFSLV